MRLDIFLEKKGFVKSRNKAKELIKSKKVKVDGKIITKPSFDVDNPKIEILEEIFVSRAALKLKNYLDKYNICFNDKLVLDIGASTGGFSEVSLLKGAKKVVAVDVGKNQLDKSLKENPKIVSFEETDIRDFSYPYKFDVIVSDVSFISLLKIINKIDELAKNEIILLFKPQFEVGKDVKRDKKGVVKDKDAIKRAIKKFESLLVSNGLKTIKQEESKIKGKEGNVEYFYYIQR